MKLALPKKANDPVDAQITKVLARMDEVGVDTDDYVDLVRILERLNDLKAQTKPSRISRDMLLQVGGSILEIAILVVFEHAHTIRSNGAFSRIRRVSPPRPPTSL